MSSITLACWVDGDENASVWVQVNLQVGKNYKLAHIRFVTFKVLDYLMNYLKTFPM